MTTFLKGTKIPCCGSLEWYEEDEKVSVSKMETKGSCWDINQGCEKWRQIDGEMEKILLTLIQSDGYVAVGGILWSLGDVRGMLELGAFLEDVVLWSVCMYSQFLYLFDNPSGEIRLNLSFWRKLV